MHRIPVHQIMQTEVITIQPDQLAADAAQTMAEHNCRRLPVVDEENCVVGIVTDSDVREAETAGSLRNSYEPGAEDGWLTVGDIMTPDVVVTTPEATIGQLAELFIAHKVGGLPVVESTAGHPKRQQLVGIVTETDIFAMIAAAWQAELTPS